MSRTKLSLIIGSLSAISTCLWQPFALHEQMRRCMTNVSWPAGPHLWQLLYARWALFASRQQYQRNRPAYSSHEPAATLKTIVDAGSDRVHARFCNNDSLLKLLKLGGTRALQALRYRHRGRCALLLEKILLALAWGKANSWRFACGRRRRHFPVRSPTIRPRQPEDEGDRARNSL